jgi:epoxide hydrolase-like predicted phosphatase
MSMSIRAVICDLFDVLLLAGDATQSRAYEQKMGLPESGLRGVMQRSPYFRDAVVGKRSGEELWRDIALSIGESPENWQKLVDVYCSAIALNTELVAFLRALRPHYKTAILSNASLEVRAFITGTFHLDREFDLIIISSEEGMRKPEPELYRLALNRLDVLPSEAFFIDDEQRYVEGARALGMHALQFKDTAQAVEEMKQYLERDGG